MAMSTGNVIGSATMLIIGVVIAAVTIVGLITSQVNSSSTTPGNAVSPTIPYGSVQ